MLAGSLLTCPSLPFLCFQGFMDMMNQMNTIPHSYNMGFIELFTTIKHVRRDQKTIDYISAHFRGPLKQESVMEDAEQENLLPSFHYLILAGEVKQKGAFQVEESYDSEKLEEEDQRWGLCLTLKLFSCEQMDKVGTLVDAADYIKEMLGCIRYYHQELKSIRRGDRNCADKKGSGSENTAILGKRFLGENYKQAKATVDGSH
ncbi:hypothetical protein SASPL_153000 [Salvia splendens]|uniref:Uncharacterized protein n=1 Tax=Salvia splendens TaxID=180675 RepID=A0A8X8Z0W2_SALSN|nr:hypothetical protein SASPL_153000 [Salvia splendens]